jgi:propanol-preferring alcohol dehydrogenase
MKAMMLKKLSRLPENRRPLVNEEVSAPAPGAGEILVKVSACGVCHTELDEIEGRTPPPLAEANRALVGAEGTENQRGQGAGDGR